jgi:hypothetical protein
VKAMGSRSVELAREAFRQCNDSLSKMFGPRPSIPGVENVVLNYYRFQRLSCGLTEEQAREEVAAAFEAARLKHRDFDEYGTAMAFVAGFVVPDMRSVVGALSIDQYLEILYAAAKHADFLGFRDGKVQ